MDKTISINLTRAELASVLGAAIAVIVAVWNLGAYIHGVMSNANDLSKRVVSLENAVAEVQTDCACVDPIAYHVTPEDPIQFSMGSLAAADIQAQGAACLPPDVVLPDLFIQESHIQPPMDVYEVPSMNAYGPALAGEADSGMQP